MLVWIILSTSRPRGYPVMIDGTLSSLPESLSQNIAVELGSWYQYQGIKCLKKTTCCIDDLNHLKTTLGWFLSKYWSNNTQKFLPARRAGRFWNEGARRKIYPPRAFGRVLFTALINGHPKIRHLFVTRDANRANRWMRSGRRIFFIYDRVERHESRE